MQGLITNLLDLARIEVGALSVFPQPSTLDKSRTFALRLTLDL